MKKCAVCGKAFIPDPKAHGTKYCSRRCYLLATAESKRSKTRRPNDKRKHNRPIRDDFLPIPQASRYEVNSQGIIRNAKTGTILKWFNSGRNKNSKQRGLTNDDGRRVTVTLPNLLWLVHGMITSKTQPIPIVLEKGTRYLRFDSCRQAAFFLAGVTDFSPKTFINQFIRRAQTFADWKITYLQC